MARSDSQYVCQSCGAVQPKWAGRCEGCGEWNTLAEEAARRGAEVTLLAANVAMPPPEGVETVNVETTAELQAAEQVGGLVQRTVAGAERAPHFGDCVGSLMPYAVY